MPRVQSVFGDLLHIYASNRRMEQTARRNRMKKKIEKPICPKCNKPMQIISTGELVRTFGCCGETVIIQREEKK